MNHIDEGDLRAYLDHELDPGNANRIRDHLDSCAACAASLARLEARAARIEARLSVPATAIPSLVEARSRLAGRPFDSLPLKENDYMQTPRRFKARYAALATAAILLVALMFPPVQSWAGQLLGLFRVQQVTVIPVDFDSLGAGFDSDNETLITEMLSENVKAESIGEAAEVSSWDEARVAAGFPVRSPSSLSDAPSAIRVSPGSRMEITLDAERLRALVGALGRDDISIPDSLTGATMNVEVPQGVEANWGDCGGARDAHFEEGASRDAVPVSENGRCTSLFQIPSPTVTTPPDLDMVAMGQLYLEVLGLSREEALDLGSAFDWSSTLVIPVPRDEADYREVAVDGVTGTLVQSKHGGNSPYMIIWVRDGVVYGVVGSGDSVQGLAIANSLN